MCSWSFLTSYFTIWYLCRFSISGKVVGAVGGASCSSTDGGPSNVNVELLDANGDVVSSVLTSVSGSYSFTNVNPGKIFSAKT